MILSFYTKNIFRSALIVVFLSTISLITSAAVLRGPYLQQGDSDSMIVKWRSSSSYVGQVKYGTSPSNLNMTANESSVHSNHRVSVTGLSPSTRYYYSIGSSSSTEASGSSYFFETSPPRGTAVSTRIWALGDSGTGNSAAASVRDHYLNQSGDQYTDLLLLLGDNAY